MSAQPVVRIGIVAVVALVAAPVMIVAQTPAQPDYRRVESQRGAELSLFGGAAAAGTGAGPSLGWSLGWRPTERVAIEGSGSWTEDPEVEGFAAMIGPRFYLNPTGRTAIFISAEAGLFHASVDPANSSVPAFYADRMRGVPVEKAFNDFVAAGGGGLDVRLRGRLWLRPQARLLFIVDGWTTNMVALFGAHISYRFTEPSSTP